MNTSLFVRQVAQTSDSVRVFARAYFMCAICFCAGCGDTRAPTTSPAPVASPGATVSSSAHTSTVQSSGTVASSAPSMLTPSGALASSKRFGFDSDSTDAAPQGFLFGMTGKGGPGRWIVRAEKDAPSGPNALVQVDTDDTDYRFPLAVIDTVSLKDVRAAVRCKPISGKVDQACGLVIRYQDANNYVITRANALEGNVRLYVVKNGERKQLASWSGNVVSGVWHDYKIEARGDRFEIWWDSAKILDHHDGTFSTAGKIGVWTKADSVTAFDDLTVEAL